MNLAILSPTNRKELAVQWVEVQTPEGEYVILPGHAPFIAEIAPKSTITFSRDGNILESIPIAHGLVSVDRKQVTIIIDE